MIVKQRINLRTIIRVKFWEYSPKSWERNELGTGYARMWSRTLSCASSPVKAPHKEIQYLSSSSNGGKAQGRLAMEYRLLLSSLVNESLRAGWQPCLVEDHRFNFKFQTSDGTYSSSVGKPYAISKVC